MPISIAHEQRRQARERVSVKQTDSVFSPLQKWKPKGSALQHLVSGLCLDGPTPTGSLVVSQCRPQAASQTWEPQIIS